MRFPAEAAQFIFDGKARTAAIEELNKASAEQTTILSYACPDYPERLREIFDPPQVLWVRGDTSQFSKPSIAIVGMRHPTPFGSGLGHS